MLPEHKLLIDIINNRFKVSDLAGLTTENGITMVSEASRHRIAPLLYKKIKQSEAESAVPADVLRELRKKYLAIATRNTILFHQLSELVERLNKNNIPVIILKGAHLAEFVYKDIALRPMSDLDIMVREEDLPETVRIAFSAGYQFFYDKNNPKEKSGKSYCYDILEHYKHFQPLIHPETKCLLEIHCFITEVGSPFQIPASDLWEAATPATLNGNSVFLLSPEDLIIYLCLHTAYDHLFAFGMGALYDISLTIRHYGEIIDWRKIIIRSEKWRTRQSLMLSLYFTKKWFGAEIPDEIFKNFRIGEMVSVAEERIFNTTETVPFHPHYIRWRNLKGMREKIRYIGKVLLPSRDFMANRYIKPKHSRVLFGSYFFRFFQALKGIYGIASTALYDGQYVSRRKQGDSDFRLRQWLTGS